ncbi:MAG: hypothetical protein IIB19_06575, partial [Chloroflexi bacterium]|nr:hypothetical protein [Chloroflexota bacterium]
MVYFASSILDRFREVVEREEDKTVLQLQTEIFRGLLRGDRPVFNLAMPRIGELVPLGFDYERERMDRPSTRPDNFLDAIRRISDEDLGIAPRPSRELPRPDTAPQPSADEGGGLFGGIRGLAGDIGGFLGGAAQASLDAPLDSSFPGMAGLTALFRGAQITQAVTRGETDRLLEPLTLKTMAQTAIEPSLPEPVFEQIERIPIAGRPLADEARFLTSPAGVVTTAAAPGLTALGAAGGVAAGTAGEGAEALGAPGPIGEIAQVAGNILTPGAGVVRAPKAVTGALSRRAGDVAVGQGDTVLGSIARTFADPAAQRVQARPLAGAAEDVNEARDRLIAALKQSKRLGPEQEDITHAARQAQAARLRGALGKTPPGEARIRAGLGALKGELPKVEFEAPVMKAGDDFTLYGAIDEHFAPQRQFRAFDENNTAIALQKVTVGGMPSPSEIALLEEVFGPKLGMALFGKRPRGAQFLDEVQAAINIPRTLLASFDQSMPLRQAVLVTLNPRRWRITAPALRDQMRAFANEKVAVQLDDVMRQTPEFHRMQGDGVNFVSFRGTAPAGERVEAFMTAGERTFIGRWLRRLLPPVKWSERAAATYQNQVMYKQGNQFYRLLDQAAGGKMPKDQAQQLGELINVLNGRASAGPLEKYAPLL